MTKRVKRRCLLHLFRRKPPENPTSGTHPVTQPDEVRKLVGAMDLPAALALQHLTTKLAELRGRPIKILPYPAFIVAEFLNGDEPLPYGVWIADERADYVFYRTDTTPSHQQHIILHELGHISCRHVGEQIPPGLADGERSASDAAVGVLKRASGFGEDQEQAAETFAYLVERQTRPNLSATGDTAVARYRLLED
ncbi:hypothetical protein G3I59_36840 [Amycolatopsis rubida]|uniref:IrrE N-terminal-like domain-containing protein n=1 Tax=Amycolatopsis rubida TaxID=112413 RepID=A0ABX0C7Y6_9PSEU|nr:MULTISPECIES: hypothetical protein [Amycolatopsis]MYW96027.1 hypothetical protein [Amycolatopsis rubida]NEC61018.1 hypothetical protein [Amycolatopsis rubida]OAP20544.1 hypothetical protein A4R44_08704 [Amycolatopsis sp. M39]